VASPSANKGDNSKIPSNATRTSCDAIETTKTGSDKASIGSALVQAAVKREIVAESQGCQDQALGRFAEIG